MQSAQPPTHWHRAALRMDTVVEMTAVTARPEPEVAAAFDRAFRAFSFVEEVCSRFRPDSELSRLCRQVGTPVRVSALLFEAVRFAREVAALTGGAFDPTIGARLEAFGFNREYLTQVERGSGVDPDNPVSHLDVLLDEGERTIALQRPMVFDLGAVAKGLAIDLAVRDLSGFTGALVNAGGDLFAAGVDANGEPWRIGIRDPARPDGWIESLRLSDAAVCTSGGDLRRSPLQPDLHHVIDARSGLSPTGDLSCTVVAPYAMAADAFATAAFLLGREQGLRLLDQAGLAGAFVGPALDLHINPAMARYLQ